VPDGRKVVLESRGCRRGFHWGGRYYGACVALLVRRAAGMVDEAKGFARVAGVGMARMQRSCDVSS
jgi:hypothetical protein